MGRLFAEKRTQWLLPTVLILFILEVLTLPVVLGVTYTGRSEGPDHVLTYEGGALVWDSATGIDENGVAMLDLFRDVYDDTVDGNGENVIAPGTEGYNIVRLKNDGENAVKYTAILYRIRTSDQIPVEAQLLGDGLEDTFAYGLPDWLAQDQVIRAVAGTVESDRQQDFDISWLWSFEEGEEQDRIDTLLGNEDNLGRVVVGLYIVIEDEGGIVTPEPPATGDSGYLGMYLTLMVISLCALLLLWWDRRRGEKCER